MSCRRAWNDEFLDLNFTRAFRKGDYTKHRENILIDREIAILPTRQPRVEATLMVRDIQQQQREINKELFAFEKLRSVIIKKSTALSAKLARYSAEAEGRPPPAWTLTEGEKKTERAKFIMKCPDGECRGFLSTVYKCGTCQKWACPDCLIVKGLDKDAEHTCDPGQKESVALIVKESRPCPKCGERISKIDGCFAKNTPILTWSGNIKMSQEIKEGDQLVGDDGCVRTVLETCHGEDEMYEVTQSRGITYVVNSKHKLPLKFQGDREIYWYERRRLIEGEYKPYGVWRMNWFNSNTFTICTKRLKIYDLTDEKKQEAYSEIITFRDSLPDEIFEISVDEYMKLPQYVKKKLVGFKSSEINWSKKDVKVNPYILGVWLGGGAKDIASNLLNEYDLIKKKHIPNDYLTNDRETRLALLAGLIDIEGHLDNNGKRIQILQSNHALGHQIEILARSLGFVVSAGFIQKENYLRISISGTKLSDIPTLVARKKCVDSKPNKDMMKGSIRVEPVGKGEYYGWSITGNKRFLMADMTVNRNCDQMWCIECHTAFSWTTGQQVNGVVHNPHYYEFLRKQGNGTAPRNAGDVPCGGVPYYNHLTNAMPGMPNDRRAIIMAVHRITSEIADQRITVYQGNFNVDDNGDLGVKYLMKEIDKNAMKEELAKRETKRNKHLAIRAVLEMFVTTSTMMLNNIVSNPLRGEAGAERLETILLEYTNLRIYVNDSLMNVSRMKNCSVPQIGDKWEWKPFNKVAPKKRITKKAVVPVAAAGEGAVAASVSEESDNETV